MVLGVLFGRKRYPLLKYFFVLLIVIGVSLFMYKDKAATPKAEEKAETDFDIFSYIGIGEILLLVSLTCDGLTGAVQVRLVSLTISLRAFMPHRSYSVYTLSLRYFLF